MAQCGTFGDAPLRDFREIRPGVWSVLDDERSYEVHVSGDDVYLNGLNFRIEQADPRQWDPRAAQGALRGGAQIKAPMPGKVVRVLVEAGQEIQRGQGIVIVEAMKMQNELKSPRDGRVVSISARENDTVNAGTVLATIE